MALQVFLLQSAFWLITLSDCDFGIITIRNLDFISCKYEIYSWLY
jgi:hypothetical protein